MYIRGVKRAPILLVLVAASAALAGDAPKGGGAASPEDVRRKKGELVIVEKAPAVEPAEALALAAELGRAGGDLYTALFARGWSTGPGIRAATADGAERSARAIAARTMLAGRGLPLLGSRYAFVEHARAKAAGERVPGVVRDFYAQRLGAFARAAGLDAAPKEAAAPVYLPLGASGNARADAVGLGILASVRLAAELAGDRRQDRGQAVVGASPEAGFEGLCHLALAAAQLQALRSHLAFDGKAFVEAALVDYDPSAAPRWFPHEAKVLRTGEDDGAPAFEVADPKSRLFDQAAILLGACEFARLRDAARSPSTAGLFGPMKEAGDVRDELFSPGLATGARDIARFVFRNLAALHFDPGPGRLTFVSEASPEGKGARVDLADAALAVVALDAAHDLFADDAKIRAEVKKLLVSQAQFLHGKRRPDGSLPGAFDLAGGGGDAPASLAAEALAIQAFLAAARTTGDEKYLAAALALARSLEARRYDPWVALYLGTDPAAEAALAPADQAFALGALRDLALEAKAPEALDRFRDFYQALETAGAFAEGRAATLRVKVSRP